MAQIVEHFISDLQIDVKKEEECIETLEREKNVIDIKEATDSLKKSKDENRHNQILSELLETERKYVQDLEEVCSTYLPLARDPAKRSSLFIDRPRVASCVARRLHSCPTINQSYNQHTGESGPAVDRKQICEMLGNVEDIKDYHKKVMLPKLEKASSNSNLMRDLFECEKSKLSIKYGRYCINTERSSSIIAENLQFFSLLQTTRGLQLRVDAQLIKPVQRITRYHMFLSGLAKASADLGNDEASADYSAALDAILAVADHTNTMMWVGKMEGCPIRLCSQGHLLKHGKVLSRRICGSFKIRNKWPCHLLLFQQAAVLCRIVDKTEEQKNPNLQYLTHVSLNHIKDLMSKNSKTFEIHKLKQVEGDLPDYEFQKSEVIMKLEFNDEDEKETWRKIIKAEIDQLNSMAFSL
eukprot:GFUD01004524.1.p1 GENE.GFUD01004524.1~~GFUD01004524.1.p1  ORF type:complete len:411 (+),score=113.27 GFUD01004524.1:116-1348(+)